jgi:hypothetical protein
LKLTVIFSDGEPADATVTIFKSDGSEKEIYDTIEISAENAIDGKLELLIENYEEGRYIIEVVAAGYKLAKDLFDIQKDKLTSKEIVLQRLKTAITFNFSDSSTGDALTNVVVKVHKDNEFGEIVSDASTNSESSITFQLTPGDYSFNFSKTGYETKIETITVVDDELAKVYDIKLEKSVYAVMGIVSDGSPSDLRLIGATVNIRSGLNNTTGSILSVATTITQGSYSIELKSGSYTLEFTIENYIPVFENVIVYAENIELNVALPLAIPITVDYLAWNGNQSAYRRSTKVTERTTAFSSIIQDNRFGAGLATAAYFNVASGHLALAIYDPIATIQPTGLDLSNTTSITITGTINGGTSSTIVRHTLFNPTATPPDVSTSSYYDDAFISGTGDFSVTINISREERETPKGLEIYFYGAGLSTAFRYITNLKVVGT